MPWCKINTYIWLKCPAWSWTLFYLLILDLLAPAHWAMLFLFESFLVITLPALLFFLCGECLDNACSLASSELILREGNPGLLDSLKSPGIVLSFTYSVLLHCSQLQCCSSEVIWLPICIFPQWGCGSVLTVVFPECWLVRGLQQELTKYWNKWISESNSPRVLTFKLVNSKHSLWVWFSSLHPTCFSPR